MSALPPPVLATSVNASTTANGDKPHVNIAPCPPCRLKRRPESIHLDADDAFPVRFEWTQPSASVGITGSFNNWGSQLLLKRVPPPDESKSPDNASTMSDKSSSTPKSNAVPAGHLALTLYLPVGTHFFKYCVDGEWKYDPEVVFAPDEYGNLTNFVRVFPQIASHTGEKVVQYPVRTMLRDAPNGLPVMNPVATDELMKLRSQALSGGQNLRSPPPLSRTEATPLTEAPPLLTNLRAPQETIELEYDLNVGASNSLGSSNSLHSASTGGPLAQSLLHSLRSRAPTLTRSRSEESLARPTVTDQAVTPKYSNNSFLGESASVLLAATTSHFGGDLVTHEHNMRAQAGGHRSSLITTAATQSGAAAPLSRRSGKLIIFLVGLPGRGKTFIGHILARHLTWMGHQSKIFNTGEYRRRMVNGPVNHKFWDPSNTDSAVMRAEIARQCLEDSIKSLEDDSCDCAIFDATNATQNRRRMLLQELNAKYKCEMLYIESILNQPDIIASSINDMKLNSADYAARTLDETAEDYCSRIAHYEAVYEGMDPDRESDLPFIKIIDVGRQIFVNQVHGYLQSRIMFLLANLNLKPRPIWLSRHGESIYNTQKRIGGDSPLSPLGIQYAMQLDRFIDAYYPAPDTELAVWTSTMLRTGMTVERIAARGRSVVKWKQLDEIDAGICDGMTYEQVAEEMPEEYLARKNNKVHYRYPRGESYQDVIHRVEPVIMELMRTDTPVLIVAHQAILRVLYGYLTNRAPSECPTLNIPLHVVIQVTPKAYRCEEVWHRPM